MNDEISEHMSTSLSALRDVVHAAIDEVDTTGELSALTWQRLSENYTVLFFLTYRQSLTARAVTKEPSWTCPDCDRTTHSPQDVRHEYCGHCHTFPETRTPS